MKLPGCMKKDCTFTEFENYINKIGYTYKTMDELCNSEEPMITESDHEILKSRAFS
jgi:hypothetical protein